ncbi:MAG TPA: YsnF/AvaK domain-containing protein [Burkholderiales bacterium]|nr:YsnF/AvaK domain-containing protein [Burkholderiales bacterium]
MAKTVVGLMDSYSEAQAAVRDLSAAGFSGDHIGLVAHERHASDLGVKAKDGSAASGALAGAGAGAAVGGIAGLLLALAPLAIPGIGPIIAAGPIAAALAGAGLGALAGGMIGGLTKLGVPEEDAHVYAEGVRRGGTLVTASAETDAQADRAVAILKRHGAVDIEERAATWRKEGWSGQLSDKGETIPVVKEEIAVGKRKVSKGKVKVYSHVHERPFEETVKLRDEKAHIERRPVDRPVTAADQAAFNERVYEVRESAEEPVVEKRARVKEEVSIGKQQRERTETIRDTVRETEVEVERAASGTYDGPERRMAMLPFGGAERRKLI